MFSRVVKLSAISHEDRRKVAQLNGVVNHSAEKKAIRSARERSVASPGMTISEIKPLCRELALCLFCKTFPNPRDFRQGQWIVEALSQCMTFR
uniref:Tho2 domain-containing protein n=1 Tax=Steinernema glaseri TaxID=37863 RepID=A0A1I7YYD7_9BILA